MMCLCPFLFSFFFYILFYNQIKSFYGYNSLRSLLAWFKTFIRGFFFGFFKPGQNSLTELERLKKWAVTVVRCFPVYAAEIYSSVCIP